MGEIMKWEKARGGIGKADTAGTYSEGPDVELGNETDEGRGKRDTAQAHPLSGAARWAKIEWTSEGGRGKRDTAHMHTYSLGP